MAERCIECRLNKKKVFFDKDKAYAAAKKAAIENEKTFAIYKEGKTICYTDLSTAVASGYDIIQMVSQHL